nr:prolactin-8A9-like [Meriones unguiculatus]
MTQEEVKGNPPERDKYVIINLLTFPGDIQTWFTYEHDFLLSHGYAYPWGLSASIYSRRKLAECMTPVKQLTRVSTQPAWELLSDGAAIESTSLLYYTSIQTKKYLKMLINFVGAWDAPLYHLVVELSAMDDVPETILSKAKEIEENNRELLDDLRWILTKAYPTEKTQENFPRWQHLPYIKSSLRNDKFLAIFNLSNCLRSDIHFTIFHLKKLKCRITRKNC